MPSLLWKYTHFTEGSLKLVCLKRKENVSGGKNQMWLSLGKWVKWQWNPRNSMQINAGRSSRMSQDCAPPGLLQGQAKPSAPWAHRGQISPARTQPRGCPCSAGCRVSLAPDSLAQSPTRCRWGWKAPGNPCLTFFPSSSTVRMDLALRLVLACCKEFNSILYLMFYSPAGPLTSSPWRTRCLGSLASAWNAAWLIPFTIL